MTTPLDVLTRVQTALEGLADVLAAGRPDAVIAAETPLAEASRRLALLTSQTVTVVNKAELRRQVLDARAAIARCERLGASLSAVTAHLFPQPVYGPGPRAGRVTRTVAART